MGVKALRLGTTLVSNPTAGPPPHPPPSANSHGQRTKIPGPLPCVAGEGQGGGNGLTEADTPRHKLTRRVNSTACSTRISKTPRVPHALPSRPFRHSA